FQDLRLAPPLVAGARAMRVVAVAGRYLDPGEAGAEYVEHLRRADLSVGTYSLRAGATDLQSPHAEDEVYVVTIGRGQFSSGGQTVEVGPGSVIFVPAHQPHFFHDVANDLAALVFFGPAYGSRDSGGAVEDESSKG
ncbi:MAG TPA: cupin domain-containing protein, partial [Acidimicrobiales bacterium]|nr:cupin domain-containing protein [Acidimicrobiales bacterium]